MTAKANAGGGAADSRRRRDSKRWSRNKIAGVVLAVGLNSGHRSVWVDESGVETVPRRTKKTRASFGGR